ncbi:MAG: LptE family protein [Verrucomicrobia bacterium]|nr:LptE family protein [Verrucomicrobiota bacterium]
MWRAVLFIVLFSTGCGYRWQPEYPEGHRPTITIPFAQGDADGALTNEIARSIAISGIADVRLKKADYRLEIKILDSNNETIGFRLDKQKVDGKIKKNMVSCESRKIVTIEATLFKSDTDQIAYGPYTITGDTAYDYVDGDSYQDLTFKNSRGITQAVLPFSLGQLESYESAQEAATRPLYSQISQKVVDVISSEW